MQTTTAAVSKFSRSLEIENHFFFSHKLDIHAVHEHIEGLSGTENAEVGESPDNLKISFSS